jgi:hypothetical protein
MTFNRRNIVDIFIRVTFVALTIVAMAGWLWALGTGVALISSALVAI